MKEIDQDEMCDLCEKYILGCKSNTSTFLCEGSRCEEAEELYWEIKEEENREKISISRKYLLLLG